MENRKILFVCPQPLWPTNTGARLRNFHLAHALCSQFDVTVLQAVDPSQSQMPPPAYRFQNVLSANRDKSYTPSKIIRGLVGPTPITVLNYFSKNIERALLRTLDSATFAAVQIESIHMATYRHLIQAHKTAPFLLLDWHNIESELAKRYSKGSSNPAKKLVAARTADLLYRMEREALASCSAHTVVSNLERQKLLNRMPEANIHVIPNGVDLQAFATTSSKSPARQTLLFVGSMDYHANVEAVVSFSRDIWPQVEQRFPNLDFKIVGRNPPATVRQLASSRITITGTVNNVQPYYQEAFAVIVPLRVGGGTRLKILEAMAARVPVISTRLGAEGIDVEDGQTILLAETADEIAVAIETLLNQPELVTRLKHQANKLVELQYDWSVIGRKLAGVLDSFIGAKL